MDPNDPAQRRMFFEVHRDLPREGPGNRASTVAALDLVRDGGTGPLQRVVDVACGPGMQTLDLADSLPRARILALDLHEPFLGQLAVRLASAGYDRRVTPIRADMTRLPVGDAAVDLIWCEGAAYIMGVAPALEVWRGLLRQGGACAFSEAVWLRSDPPPPVRELWSAYAGMGDLNHTRSLIRRAGFDLVGDFVLPAAAWWDDYYLPMSERIDRLEVKYAADAVAAAVLSGCRHEIDIYRRYSDWYGYGFFVARKT